MKITQQTITTGGVPDSTELLRQILALEKNRNVDYTEAEEVGESLMTLFEALVEVN